MYVLLLVLPGGISIGEIHVNNNLFVFLDVEVTLDYIVYILLSVVYHILLILNGQLLLYT